MTEKLSQHWVPQYHLRLFSDGKRCIHAVLRDGSRVIEQAGIKGQCARRRFYGDVKTEDWLAGLEMRHAVAYREVLRMACGDRDDPLRTSEDRILRQALAIQRARTPRHAWLFAHSGDQALLYTYREYLGTLPPTRERVARMRAIEQGRASLRGSVARSLASSLEIAAKTVEIISDLRLLVLRNATDTPFLMGDTPCVASNHFMRDIEGVGVIGLSKRGLMLSMPLDSRTHVLLFDGAVYRAARYHVDTVDVSRPGDVSVLNALQVYGAQTCVYFSDLSNREYVRDFVAEHPAGARDHAGGFNVLRPALGAGGSPAEREELLHMFEPQLPVTLDLSFIQTQILPPNLNIESPRRPKLIEHLENLYMAGRPRGPLGIDELVRVVESEFVVSDSA